MSVQDFIKKSILESGAYDGATMTNIVMGLAAAFIIGIIFIWCTVNFT